MKMKYGEIGFLIFFGIMVFGFVNIAYNGNLTANDLYVLLLLGVIYVIFKIWDRKKKQKKNNQT